MKNSAFPKRSQRRSHPFVAIAGGLLFIGLAMVGSLALCSCANTPKGIQREQALFLIASNGVATAHQISPYLPPPAGTLLEGALALCGAGLALWASHLHRSVGELKRNGGGNGNGAKAPSGGPLATGSGTPTAGSP